MGKFSICVIGSSHTASYKNSWDHICAAYPEVEVSFYPFFGPRRSAQYFRGFNASKSENTLTFSNPQLIKNFKALSGTNGVINTKGVDLFLVVGGVQLWDLPNRRVYSTQVCDLALENIIYQSNAYVLLQTIREISKAQVYLTHIPFYARRVLQYVARSAKYPSEIAALNQRILTKCNAKLLIQPRESFGSMRRTKLQYCVGFTERARQGKNGIEMVVTDDLLHMNRAFGALAWNEILKKSGINPNVSALEMPEANGHLSLEEKRDAGNLKAGYITS